MTQNLSRRKLNILSFALIIILPLSVSLCAFAKETLNKTDAQAIQTSEEGAWTGIDVSIVGKYASKYGHPPRDPYINTDQGDLLLFVFTFAGVVGGFVIGFNARRLFYEK
ncbi:MAG: hypothetical protein HUU08_09850 [Candidatus Brocadia sp.]|nr:hypothetical protein [Candidatus Brocadia sp.]